jgi:hypothetical protein
MESVLIKLPSIELAKIPLPPATRAGVYWKMRFNNKRELWKIQRAAAVMGMDTTTFVRIVLDTQSDAILERVAKSKARRKDKPNGSTNTTV